MKLIAYEMPESSEDCLFSMLHNPNGHTIDVEINPHKLYCRLTKKECNLSRGYCSGLLNADRMKIIQLVDVNGITTGHKFEER